ncbi:hypothetical protein ACX27_18840 [Nostoc piscinale CENA21]|uniref:Uncharacterized protein n=1 Tax=Nostoc piscinale CENA21 TaxID=224013 RepID=A0A0M4T3S5_9NOSO|nr:hypothetical protein ACX27_18840 [Nostoc piscinale CENA21]
MYGLGQLTSAKIFIEYDDYQKIIARNTSFLEIYIKTQNKNTIFQTNYNSKTFSCNCTEFLKNLRKKPDLTSA